MRIARLVNCNLRFISYTSSTTPVSLVSSLAASCGVLFFVVSKNFINSISNSVLISPCVPLLPCSSPRVSKRLVIVYSKAVQTSGFVPFYKLSTCKILDFLLVFELYGYILLEGIQCRSLPSSDSSIVQS